MKYLLILAALLGLAVSSQAQTLLISPFGGSCPTATTSVLGCVKPDGTSITISGGVISASASAPAFSAITAGTNAAALLIGTGGSLGTSGSGTITATSVPFSGVSAATNTNALVLGTGGSLSVSGTGTIAATSVTGLSVTATKTLTVSNSLTLAGTDGTTLTFPGVSATIPGVGVANTFSAAQTISVAGAASTSPLQFTGALETGGSGTTNFPHLFIQPSAATASTHWSANGTGFGMNLASGFSGNFVDFEINGAGATFAINAAGTISAAGMNSTSSTWSIAANVDSFKLASNAWLSWSSTTAFGGAQDTGLDRNAAGIVEVNLGTAVGHGGSLEATGIISTSYQQVAASNTGGTCTMSGTSCTITISHTYTTPVCIATQQSATLTGTYEGCTVSGTTVTITAGVTNTETWGAFVFGNPN